MRPALKRLTSRRAECYGVRRAGGLTIDCRGFLQSSLAATGGAVLAGAGIGEPRPLGAAGKIPG
jgi:hypothetical protein